MDVRFEQVDVFTDQPFAGNALCVVPDGTGLSTKEMQAIAREMNLSETTFVLPPTDLKPRTGCGSSRQPRRSPSPGIRVLGPRM